MGSRGILRAGRVRALAGVAALLALVLAWPAGAQVVCTGGGCGGGGGTVTSPVATDPLSLTGVVTFNNAANTPVTAADGVIDSTLTAGRVTFAGAAGRLSDDADLTFATATLTGTNIVGGTSNCGGAALAAANSVCLQSNSILFESADDANELTLTSSASADNTLTLAATASGVELNPTTGRLLTAAGTGTGRVSVGGVICKSATPVATTGTAEEILATCALPAGTMTVAGGYIRYQVEAVTAANANNKTLKIYLSASGGGLGGNVCFTTPASASNNELWSPSAPGVMFPATATTGRCSFNLWRGAKGGTAAITAMPYHTDQIAQTWANALEIVISGTTPTAAGDLTLNGYTFEVVQ